MKVIQVKKQHLKRILALIIFSCFVLSYYLHTDSDRKLKSAKHHSKKHKNESVKKGKCSFLLSHDKYPVILLILFTRINLS